MNKQATFVFLVIGTFIRTILEVGLKPTWTPTGAIRVAPSRSEPRHQCSRCMYFLLKRNSMVWTRSFFITLPTLCKAVRF